MDTGEVIFGILSMIILAGMVTTIVSIRSKPRGAERETAEAVQRIEAKLDGRFDKIEERMANIETIVLEEQKYKEFDRAL